MALFEFYCTPCQLRFEQITRLGEDDYGQCPSCHGKKTQKLISRFAVGGQGDLRESTLHGCHDHSLHGGDSHGHGDHGDHE